MNRIKKIPDKLRETFLGLSPFLRFGVMVFIISGALDLSYHVISAVWPGSLDAILGPDGYYTHLALFFGMLLVVIGVIRTKPAPVNRVEADQSSQSAD